MREAAFKDETSADFEQYVIMRKGVIQWGKGSIEDTPDEFKVVSGSRTLRVPKHGYESKAALTEKLTADLRAARFEIAVLQGEYLGSRTVRAGVSDRLADAMERARVAAARLREIALMEGPFLIVRRGQIAEREIAEKDTAASDARSKPPSSSLKDQLREAVRAGLGKRFLFTTYEQCNALRKPTSMKRADLVAVIRDHYPELLKNAPKPLSKMTKADLCALVMSAAA